MLPPTSHLPPIKSIKSIPPVVLMDSLEYIRGLYNPPVRGSTRRSTRNQKLPARETEELQSILADAFERDYAMKWLTALISLYGSGQDVDSESSLENDSILQKAASLLALCAGTASAGVISRTFAFDTDHALSQGVPLTISVELTDVPLDNHDYGSVGAQTWGGACIMAEMIVERPSTFGLLPPVLEGEITTPKHEFRHLPLRCLEIGAGTGLVGLTVAKFVEQLSCHDRHKPSFDIEVVSTDYYPAVLQNLERNIQINFPSTSTLKNLRIHSQVLDWSIFSVSESKSDPEILQTPFDVVYGADIIYEAQHAEWIKSCLEKILKKPQDDRDPLFHLIIPLRSTHRAESSTIERIFKTAATEPHVAEPSVARYGQLVIKHKEIIVCDAGSGGSDEIEYAYYRIGWGI